jgi:hypothetical protein
MYHCRHALSLPWLPSYSFYPVWVQICFTRLNSPAMRMEKTFLRMLDNDLQDCAFQEVLFVDTRTWTFLWSLRAYWVRLAALVRMISRALCLTEDLMSDCFLVSCVVEYLRWTGFPMVSHGTGFPCLEMIAVLYWATFLCLVTIEEWFPVSCDDRDLHLTGFTWLAMIAVLCWATFLGLVIVGDWFPVSCDDKDLRFTGSPYLRW